MLRANSSNPFHRYEKPTLKKLETIKYFYFYCKFQKDLRPILEHYEISEDDFVQLYLKADTNANICSNNRGQLVDFPQDAFLSAPCLQLMCWYKDQSDTEFSNLATLIKMGCKSDFMPMLADEIHEKGVHFVFQKIHSGVG
ncbi:MAG: hypothetical protein EBR02_03635 [Alphaproteobacteria bacterium]|nr:hypothetical protein [Alphaproteobacteria bacterium]